MFIAETDLIGRGYGLIGELANLVLYKRELSKHVTSLAICLRDDSNRSNTKIMMIDSSLFDLVIDALEKKEYKRLCSMLDLSCL